MNHKFRFSLQLTYQEYLRVYQGTAKQIAVTTDDGKRMVFPAGNMQTFLNREGIHGRFEMEISPENKFIGIKKLT